MSFSAGPWDEPTGEDGNQGFSLDREKVRVLTKKIFQWRRYLGLFG
jgi:hypothetical protein